MIFKYNAYKQTEPLRMYLGRPGRKTIGSLIGVETAKFHPQLRNIWEVEFEVDSKYTDDTGKIQENPIFSKINQYMEIDIETIGWFRINQHPQELLDDNGRYYKKFTAYGYETTLQDIDLNLFNINCGTDESIEMYEENLNALGLPIHNIQLWIEDANEDPKSDKYWKLGLLNILEHEHLYKKGWKIGTVDVDISTKRGRQFEIDSKTVYAFLTQDVSKSYKCLFDFDRKNMTINAYSIEHVGKNIDVELALRNVINSIIIDSQNDDVYTSFRVSGSDSDQTIIEYINYGSDRLSNYDYFIETGMIPAETADKYKIYEKWKEDNRENYANLSLKSMEISEKISGIQELEPVDEVEVKYDNLTLKELNTELTSARNVVSLLEEMHTQDGNLQIENTSDYSMYISFKEVIIPKIEAEIKKRETGEEPTEEIDWETNWELYGINELNTKLVAYQRQVDTLKEKGYDKPWSADTGNFSKDFHDRQYELYTKYNGYIDAINKRLEYLNKEVDDLNQQKNDVSIKIKTLAAKAKITYEDWNLTDEEIALINMLTIETDYSDSTIEVQDNNTISEIIDLAHDLYKSAKKEIDIESRPQLSFSITLDNIFHMQQYMKESNDISIGDFLPLELMNGYKTKQRIIGLEIELVDFNDTDLTFEFSDSVKVNGQSSDYDFLLDNSGSSSKNSISKSSSDSISAINNFSSMAAQILMKYITGSGSNGLITSGMSDEDLRNLADALTGMIEVQVSIDQLAQEIGKIESLELNTAFMRFLNTLYEVDNQDSFKTVKILVGNIQKLLSGDASVKDIIHLTNTNTELDLDFIIDKIAKHIKLDNLNESTLSTGKFPIFSPEKALKIEGNFLTVTDSNEIIRVKIGFDTENGYICEFRDENGNLFMDGNGIVNKTETTE